MSTVYVLELERGRYFVGSSSDPEKALIMHREGLGPAWTQIYRPRRLFAVHSATQTDAVVRTYMEKFGMEMVRGGSWEQVRLEDRHRKELRLGAEEDRGCAIV